MATEEFITACPRNCYSTCTFRVRVEDKRISKILPYSDNLATPEGPCIKGLSYIERTYSPDRIIYPLRKDSSGKFSRISTDEALEIASSELLRIREKYGAHSILWYKGSGMSGLTNEIGSEFWKAFGGATTTYGNLCWPAGLEAVRLTLGSVKHNVPWDLVNARTIIIWGKNPAETNVQEIAFIAEAREKGCRIIVIDPLRTPSADKAVIFFSPRPGTDAALALAIAKILIDENLVDSEFIGKYVYGYEAFRNSLRITPSMAATITGIPEEQIIRLAFIIGNGAPLTIIPGYGLQRHLNGGQTIRSILSLAIITGNLGKTGTGFNYANLQSYIYDDPKEPVSYYPDPAKDTPFRRTISMAKAGRDMLKVPDSGLKAAWVERGNPLLQLPDSQNVKKAFRKMEFRVVVEQFMTDTALEADIILPAKDIFEQSDIVGSYWSPYVQFKPKIIDSPGEVMPESEIWFHMARKSGFDISTDKIPLPGNSNIEIWLEKRIDGFSDLKLDDLRRGPVLAPGLQQIAYSDFKFETPSGKIELSSVSAAEMWGVSELPEYVPLDTIKEDFPLTLLTPNAANRIHSQFGNLKVIRESTPFAAMLISVSDAAERSINDGDKIRIFNENGSIVSAAEVSGRLPSGIVVLPNGIWTSEGGGGNDLTAGLETDMGYGAAFHDARVQVEKEDRNG
ncbi:MAG TPA: molybdopterin-dependent oxidoreductase [Bacteroidales bacterium]|nr:molybdopterin-dependent oxidoreductase [Bacteroidales bacterium]